MTCSLVVQEPDPPGSRVSGAEDSGWGFAAIIPVRDLLRRLALIAVAARGGGPGRYTMTGCYDRDIAMLPELSVAAGRLWRRCGLRPAGSGATRSRNSRGATTCRWRSGSRRQRR